MNSCFAGDTFLRSKLCKTLILTSNHFRHFFHFIFSFLSLDSIDYINDHIGTDLSATAHYWAKILAYYTKKITIIKKKRRRPRILSHRPPARPRSITEAAEFKANFWSTDPTKNIKRIQKFDPPPHLYNWLAKRIVSV